ncbi:hypothetical protein [Pseudomonas gingeri]|uniref:Uncharacterized protein n=2 Tax=Pseudomonas gingeri TaxID=117681 RepID=A0A7Y8CLA4_9PSED|nr:hypothetical protein [Pseudomonas gingeri]NWC35343.1 hypothetical protein [Pseudomonas gingeri]NWD07894.1 hypothetical protein [Pseudomonas gingeri]NWE32317.1 hypothetical protein [Pseudomonas gingeri]NWE55443.1 hypothetical protein [Pseudomonas gingeri]NWF00377.1 hypothetical protein [Pseudomonas gingeri]
MPRVSDVIPLSSVFPNRGAAHETRLSLALGGVNNTAMAPVLVASKAASPAQLSPPVSIPAFYPMNDQVEQSVISMGSRIVCRGLDQFESFEQEKVRQALLEAEHTFDAAKIMRREHPQEWINSPA